MIWNVIPIDYRGRDELYSLWFYRVFFFLHYKKKLLFYDFFRNKYKNDEGLVLLGNTIETKICVTQIFHQSAIFKIPFVMSGCKMDGSWGGSKDNINRKV